MKKDRKRIALGRETLRHLTQASLQDIAGGRINESRLTVCGCATANGCPGDTLTVSAVGTACTVTKVGQCDF
jgi:hypothetical protein